MACSEKKYGVVMNVVVAVAVAAAVVVMAAFFGLMFKAVAPVASTFLFSLRSTLSANRLPTMSAYYFRLLQRHASRPVRHVRPRSSLTTPARYGLIFFRRIGSEEHILRPKIGSSQYASENESIANFSYNWKLVETSTSTVKFNQ